MNVIDQNWSYSGKTIDGCIGARLSPRASGQGRGNVRVKEVAENSRFWDREQDLSLERAWNSKFAKQSSEQLAASPSMPRSPRTVTGSTQNSRPVGFISTTHAPALSLSAGVSSFVPGNNAFADPRATDFPVWSSYQIWRKYSSSRGMSMPIARPRFGTAEHPRDTTTGYVMPPTNGGKSLDRFIDRTPGVVQDRSLPIGLRAWTPLSHNDPTMFELLRRRHQRETRMAQAYPTSNTAWAAHSDPVASRGASSAVFKDFAQSGLAAVADARLDAQEGDLQQAYNNLQADLAKSGLAAVEVARLDAEEGDLQRARVDHLQAVREFLHHGPQILTERGKAVHDASGDPNIWTERGKEVYDAMTQ